MREGAACAHAPARAKAALCWTVEPCFVWERACSRLDARRRRVRARSHRSQSCAVLVCGALFSVSAFRRLPPFRGDAFTPRLSTLKGLLQLRAGFVGAPQEGINALSSGSGQASGVYPILGACPCFEAMVLRRTYRPKRASCKIRLHSPSSQRNEEYAGFPIYSSNKAASLARLELATSLRCASSCSTSRPDQCRSASGSSARKRLGSLAMISPKRRLRRA
jgi:hypothetical protein